LLAFPSGVNPCGESEQLIVRFNFAKNSLSEAKQKTRGQKTRFLLRFAQPFFAKFKRTINWSLSPQGLMSYVSTLFFFEFILQL